jgi:hypothetical protein
MTTSQTARRITALATIGLAAFALTGCSLITSALNGGESDVFSIKVGDCLNDSVADGEISTVPVVDCDELHDSEIYASAIMDDGDYPGESDTIDFANEACYDEFEGFVGISYDESIYDYATLYPTPESWAGGDREVLCRIALGDENGDIVQVKGSLENVKE